MPNDEFVADHSEAMIEDLRLAPKAPRRRSESSVPISALEERLTALEALCSEQRQRIARLTTIVADLNGRISMAETALAWRRTPMTPEIAWSNVSQTAYVLVRDRTLEIIEHGHERASASAS